MGGSHRGDYWYSTDDDSSCRNRDVSRWWSGCSADQPVVSTVLDGSKLSFRGFMGSISLAQKRCQTPRDGRGFACIMGLLGNSFLSLPQLRYRALFTIPDWTAGDVRTDHPWNLDDLEAH